MFATVKHDKGELKINPNCYLRIIYDHIRRELDIHPEKEFDLCTEEGNLCYIKQYPPNTNALSVLPPGGTFTIVIRGEGADSVRSTMTNGHFTSVHEEVKEEEHKTSVSEAH